MKAALAGAGLIAALAGCSSASGSSADAGPPADAADAADAMDATVATDGASGDAAADAGAGDAGVAPDGKAYLAFIGDSLTVGVGASTEANDWVSLVAAQLGPSVVVGNFGVSGTTMMKVSDDPYWSSNGLSRTEDLLADAGAGASARVVILLGTNDSKDDVVDDGGVDNWTSTAPQRFHDDYDAMIDLLLSQTPRPLVFLVLPPPAFSEADDIDPTVIAQQIVPIIRGLASERGLPLIDLFTALGDAGSNFPDGIHPDDTGQALVAQAMYSALTRPELPDGGP